jgi:putative effector of murein hydrolase LrgA (UPF0299 family)
MLQGFSILFGFYILGEILVYFLSSPVPGAVAGMLLLFGFLCLIQKAPESLVTTSEKLLLYLPLLLIPAGAGVMQYLDLIKEQALAILCALIIGTTVSMIFITWFSRKFIRLTSTQSKSNTSNRNQS